MIDTCGIKIHVVVDTCGNRYNNGIPLHLVIDKLSISLVALNA